MVTSMAEAKPPSSPAFGPGLDAARQLDRADELAAFRDAFAFPEPDLIYLDGNSLGRLPRATARRLRDIIDHEWARDLILSWNRGWFDAPTRLGDMIGALAGASPGQIVVGDSTSVNLFKLVIAALSMRPHRKRIVSDELNFPSDLYVLQGCVALLGEQHDIHLVPPSGDDVAADLPRLLDAIDERTALVTLSHVAFKSGYLYDVATVTRRAHDAGALVLWDLSHSIGVVPIELDRWEVDFAVGCTYKYLNGGPGSPAFLFARRDHQDAAVSPLWGWFGQRSPFDFLLAYEPAQGIKRFQVGTPPVLSLLALEPGLQLILEAGIDRIRRKSRLLTGYLTYLVDSVLTREGFSLGSPREPERRGSHISIRHPEGFRITRALTQEFGVIPDFREPDNIRLGLSPLTTSFSEVWHAVDRLRLVVAEGHHLQVPTVRHAVT